MIEWLITPHDYIRPFAIGGLIFLFVGAWFGWKLHSDWINYNSKKFTE